MHGGSLLVDTTPANLTLDLLKRAPGAATASQEPFVGLAPGNALQDHVDDHARAAGHGLTLRIRMKTFEGMCEMVAQGVGVGVMPQGIARRYRRRHGYRALTLTDDWARRRLCLCFRDWATLSPPMQSLLSHLEGKPDYLEVR